MLVLALMVGLLLGLLAFGAALYFKAPTYVALILAGLTAFTMTFASWGMLTERADATSYGIETSRYLRHYRPDAGYNVPIIYTCSWARRYGHAVPTLAEGHVSTCKIEGVFVRSGQEIWCKPGPLIGFIRWFKSPGWHHAEYSFSLGCTTRRPS